VDHYVIYRSTTPGEAGDSLAETADTSFIDSDAVGDTSTNHFYILKTVDQLGSKSAASNETGEFDLQLTSPERTNPRGDLPGGE
jgi:hypothetical protein